MFHISSEAESTFVMVTRRFAPWRLYTSAELYESRGKVVLGFGPGQIRTATDSSHRLTMGKT